MLTLWEDRKDLKYHHFGHNKFVMIGNSIKSYEINPYLADCPYFQPPLSLPAMAFSKAFRKLETISPSADDLPASLTQLPANILEVFIPGYSVISTFLQQALGFDITLIVSIFFLLFGLYTAIRFIWKHFLDHFNEYFTSFICIDSNDDIYNHVMNWLQSQKLIRKSRSLAASTGYESIWDSEDTTNIDIELEDPTVLLNFSNWGARIPPKFEPYYGSHRFFHKGRYFRLTRSTKPVASQGWGGTVFQNDESITLTCIGRSTQPIKDLLIECRDQYLKQSKACTVVRRPAPKESRSRGRGVWTMVAKRPSRPMDTVVLDHAQKNRILTDINEYLHPSTPRWYANRGIPYRRGYLFAGAPGTGKSSLAWAIAGVFGLDIYCISLVEPTLTEEDLGILFTSLPRRCVVLLEDIDSAGLVRRQEIEDVGKAKSKDDEKEETTARIGTEIAKAIKAVQDKSEKSKSNEKNQGITLSGLLNAIDGVASHEGRVLIMTTNFPEKLDDALIRPGRIDLRVDFTLATRPQISELFTRMYSPDLPNKAFEPVKITMIQTSESTLHHRVNSKAGLTEKSNSEAILTNGTLISDASVTKVLPPSQRSSLLFNGLSASSTPELEEIALKFSGKFPEGVLSPAEIQGFLLTRKKEPLRALEEVEAWRDKLLTAKAEKSKTAASS